MSSVDLSGLVNALACRSMTRNHSIRNSISANGTESLTRWMTSWHQPGITTCCSTSGQLSRSAGSGGPKIGVIFLTRSDRRRSVSVNAGGGRLQARAGSPAIDSGKDIGFASTASRRTVARFETLLKRARSRCSAWDHNELARAGRRRRVGAAVNRVTVVIRTLHRHPRFRLPRDRLSWIPGRSAARSAGERAAPLPPTPQAIRSFWKSLRVLEPNGYFNIDNLVSNEDHGSEPSFRSSENGASGRTSISVSAPIRTSHNRRDIEPRMAVITDIPSRPTARAQSFDVPALIELLRRFAQSSVEHWSLEKGPRPSGRAFHVDQIFDAVERAAPDKALFVSTRTSRAVLSIT